jgi:hypothetical protein
MFIEVQNHFLQKMIAGATYVFSGYSVVMSLKKAVKKQMQSKPRIEQHAFDDRCFFKL